MLNKLPPFVNDIRLIFSTSNYKIALSFRYVLKFFYWYGYLKPINKVFIGTYIFGLNFYFNTKYDGCAFAYFLPYMDMPYKYVEHEYLDKNDVMIDIGSSNGAHALVGAIKDAKVHVFEPNASVARLFRINILLNEHISQDNIVINDMAVSDSIGETYFYEYAENLSGESTIVGSDRNSSLIKKRTVNTTTLDNYIKINKISVVKFLKIDAEGAELKIFQGAKKVIKDRKIRLIYWETNFKSSEKEITETIKFLAKSGYLNVAYDKGILRDWKKEDQNCFSLYKSELKRVKIILNKYEKSRKI